MGGRRRAAQRRCAAHDSRTTTCSAPRPPGQCGRCGQRRVHRACDVAVRRRGRGAHSTGVGRLMTTFHIGADENGLGSRLGPMIVTAVLAEADEAGERFLARKLPKRMREDLDDSKRLMSHTNVGIGEAWARALTGNSAQTPAALFEQLSHEGSSKLREPCPKVAHAQCWNAGAEAFCASDGQLSRAKKHVATFAERGVRLLEV